MENKITYPNEFTYAPPTLPEEKGDQWWFIKRENDKAREKYREHWTNKIKELTPYFQNSILGDIVVYVNKEFICMEVNCNYTVTSRGGATTEGYRKKFIGKHITEIRDMFISIKELNFHSNNTILLKQEKHSYEIQVHQSETYYESVKNKISREELAVIQERIENLKTKIEKTKKLIEAEKLVEFPSLL